MATEITNLESTLILDWQITHNDELFEDALELCRPIMKTVGNKFANSLDPQEIESACNLAFFQAATAFKSGGVKFTTFLWLICKRKLTTEYQRGHREKMKASTGDIVKPISLETVISEDDNLTIESMVYDPTQLDPAELCQLVDDFADRRSSLEDECTKLEVSALNGFLKGKSYAEIGADIGRNLKSADNSLYRLKRKAKNLKESAKPTKPTVETTLAQDLPTVEQFEPDSKSVEEAFWKNVEKQDDECWIWKGIRRPHGVCQFSVKKKLYTALRFSWMLAHPETVLPRKGLIRLCSETWCVNPEHHQLRDCFKGV